MASIATPIMLALAMAAACLRALVLLYLVTSCCHLLHPCYFQRSSNVLFFECGCSSWLFVMSLEPEFNKYLPCQVTVVRTNLALSRLRFPAARWSKRGLTTLLIPSHDPPSDITIFMDVNPNPGPSFVQEDGLNHSRLAETHLHITSECGQTLSYSRRKLLRLRHHASRTCMSSSTYQMLKYLQIFRYRGKSAGKRKKQAKVLELSCFDGYANTHSKSQVAIENNSHCSITSFEINSYTVEQQPPRYHHVPKLMVSNVMSLAPKIDEVQEFFLRSDFSLAFITETWLKETIADSAVSIPGYTIIRKDRTTNNHGGVCLYIRDGCFKYRRLEELCCCTDHEILWVHLRPARLPRGFSCLIVAVLYHPPGADINICEHLFNSLAEAESIYPNCALIVAGDFNRLDVTRLKRHFHLKQIVKAPTRKDVILDLVLTNLHNHYDKPQTFPPFGLSDHNTISISPLARKPGTASDKFILKRDL